MRKFLCTLILVLLTQALTAIAATRTETYVYQGNPGSISSSAMYAEKVNIAIISDEGDYWSLDCYGAGNETCSWEKASCAVCTGIYTPFSDDNSLYKIGSADDLIEYAETQIATGIYSGLHHANITIGFNTYYRNVSWVYNAANGRRVCTVKITEVAP